MKRLLASILCLVLFASGFAETGELFGAMPELLDAYLNLAPEKTACTNTVCTAYYTGFDDDDFISLESFFTSNRFEIEHLNGRDNNIYLKLTVNSIHVDLAYDRSSHTAILSYPASLSATVMHAPIQKGNIVYFGSYEQDGEEKNGPERIEWIVLEDNLDSAILLSRYVLDSILHKENSSAIWEESDVRAWLNSDFYSTAFSPLEQTYIELYRATADSNPYYDTEQGNDTYDHVWLLSSAEVEKYMANKEERLAYATPYAIRKIGYSHSIVKWTLRTAGNITNNHSAVNKSGSLYSIQRSLETLEIRPAIKVRLNPQA